MMLDMDTVQGYVKNFEQYEDMLPLLLMTYIDNYKYINNLKKKGLWYDNVRKKIFNRRKKIQFLNNEELIKFEDNELKKWLKKNPKFEDICMEH